MGPWEVTEVEMGRGSSEKNCTDDSNKKFKKSKCPKSKKLNFE